MEDVLIGVKYRNYFCVSQIGNVDDNFTLFDFKNSNDISKSKKKTFPA